MLMYAGGLGQFWQTLNLSALADSKGLLVSGAYLLLGDFHTYFPSAVFWQLFLHPHP